jgi:multicomponent Na+:H+ antiporter subunit C
MIWLLALGSGATVTAGIYLALSRDLLRCVIGVSLIGVAANLVVFVAGRPGNPVPPLVPVGEAVLEGAANPLPQALVLTAIVIGFSLTCFSLILVLAIIQRTGSRDSDRLRMAEPPARDDGQPALEPAQDNEAN